jgi:hypothetical protein
MAGRTKLMQIPRKNPNGRNNKHYLCPFINKKYKKMKNNKLFLFCAILLAAAALASCDKNIDETRDPDGTFTLNMMNEENGKTLLGNSDVYIESANNFYTNSCRISPVGRKNGLGGFPAPRLDGVGNRVAVEPGYGYQMFKNAAVREFPSGALALNISADYYNVYVSSFIKKNDAVAGATVKYVLMDVPHNGLPEYEKYLGELTLGNTDPGYSSEMTITLPTADFEYETLFASSSFYTIAHEKRGKTIILSLTDVKSPDAFGLNIRIGGSYTHVYGEVIF